MKWLRLDANSICLSRKIYWKIFQEIKTTRNCESALQGALYGPPNWALKYEPYQHQCREQDGYWGQYINPLKALSREWKMCCQKLLKIEHNYSLPYEYTRVLPDNTLARGPAYQCAKQNSSAVQWHNLLLLRGKMCVNYWKLDTTACMDWFTRGQYDSRKQATLSKACTKKHKVGHPFLWTPSQLQNN